MKSHVGIFSCRQEGRENLKECVYIDGITLKVQSSDGGCLGK